MTHTSFIILALLLIPVILFLLRLTFKVEDKEAVIKKLPRVLMASTLIVFVGISLFGTLGAYWLIPVVIGELFAVGALFNTYAQHKNLDEE